jgi:hypothetical protein
VNRLTASGISLSPDFLNRLRDASGR